MGEAGEIGEDAATCSLCGGAGWTVRGDVGKPELVRCACKRDEDRERAYERLLDASNLSRRMVERQTFTSFERARVADAYDALTRFATQPSGWILLAGEPGTGKTHLLVAAANALIVAGHRPLYVIAPNFVDYLRGGIRATEDQDDVEARKALARDAEVLLLDDLGAERDTDWASEAFFQILNDRYNAEAPTVISTNVALERLPKRLESRLSDVALVQEFILDAEDYRRVQRARRGSAEGGA